MTPETAKAANRGNGRDLLKSEQLGGQLNHPNTEPRSNKQGRHAFQIICTALWRIAELVGAAGPR